VNPALLQECVKDRASGTWKDALLGSRNVTVSTRFVLPFDYFDFQIFSKYLYCVLYRFASFQ
jgi:hypothetical protein